MSWLFGIRSTPGIPAEGLPPPSDGDQTGGGGAPAGGSGDDKKRTRSMEPYSFDSAALERAAQAAKELERSKHSKEALELSKLQEETRRAEYQCKMKEYEAHIEQSKIEQKRVEGEERRKAAQYQDQLSRKRYEDQLLQQQRVNEENLRRQQQMNDENLRRQEESVAKQEALRKATLEHEMELRGKVESQKAAAKMAAKAKLERENHDLIMERIRVEAAEKRKMVLDSISSVGSLLGAGAQALLTDWDKTLTAVGGLSLLALGVYTAKGATSVTSRYIEARLGKPSLIQETSRFSFLESLKHPFKAAKKLRLKSGDALSGVVLAPSLEEKLRDIAIATKNTKRNKGMYMNILMYGPPGTGKTMFAKKLAAHSGMDYAILAGGDVAPLDKGAVTAFQKVFDWASVSPKGVVLFIDEAEAFLMNRNLQLSESLRQTLSTFLAKTGEQSDKFMLVLASNTPEQLDRAVKNRLHKKIQFPLPGLEERERLVRLYFDEYILQPATAGKRRLKVAQFDYSALCSQVAKLTEGLSGREIAQLGLDWQMAAYAAEDNVLTEKMVLDRCMKAVEEHREMVEWERGLNREESKSILPEYKVDIPKSTVTGIDSTKS